ncbi:hypothetical protein PV939_10070, partial [Ligilactobacillus salivarius]|nr:hypothetical protein [Ligilactobacillus salivarius]
GRGFNLVRGLVVEQDVDVFCTWVRELDSGVSCDLLGYYDVFFFFFFFKEEDGKGVGCLVGVQTFALPLWGGGG